MAFVCEICGSQEIIKQDGAFVCQGCGMKYTAEELKKMVSGGVVAPSKTNASDSEIEKRLQNIVREYELCHYERVINLATELLNLDPTNPQAIAHKGAAEGWQTSFSSNHYPEATLEMIDAISYAQDRSSEFNDYRPLAEWVLTEFAKMFSPYLESIEKYSAKVHQELDFNMQMRETLHKNVMSCIKDQSKYIGGDMYYFNQAVAETEKWQAKYDAEVAKWDEIYDPYKKVMDANIPAMASSLNYFLGSLYSRLREHVVLFTKEMWTAIDILLGQYSKIPEDRLDNDEKEQFATKRKEVENNYKNVKQEWVAFMQEAQRQRNEKYWSEHAKEKEELLARQIDLQAKLDNGEKEEKGLRSKIQTIEAKKKEATASEEEAKKVAEQINRLNNQLASLGVFKMKEKKELKASIDEMEHKRQQLIFKGKDERAKLEATIADECKPLNNELGEIRTQRTACSDELRKINEELTKDR